MEQDKLFEYIDDKYPTSDTFYFGNQTQLTELQYKATQDLKNYFPRDLLNEPKNILGMPDAYDQGGIYIEYQSNNAKRNWLIDSDKKNIPEKYHIFVNKVQEKIQDLP